MQSWPSFVEMQKSKLMAFKDKGCFPLVEKFPNKISANCLTYFRILLAFGLYFLLIIKSPHLVYWIIILYLLAKFTDMLDGCLARSRQQITPWGEFIDTLADKFFYLIGFLVLTTLWPEILAFHYIFLIMAISVFIVVFNGFRKLFKKDVGIKSRMMRQLFEGLGYLVAVILLIIQLIW
jgi:CDP-diacylglycerol--glycerol-3-phosphate 3-phosphatidyltransferase